MISFRPLSIWQFFWFFYFIAESYEWWCVKIQTTQMMCFEFVVYYISSHRNRNVGKLLSVALYSSWFLVNGTVEWLWIYPFYSKYYFFHTYYAKHEFIIIYLFVEFSVSFVSLKHFSFTSCTLSSAKQSDNVNSHSTANNSPIFITTESRAKKRDDSTLFLYLNCDWEMSFPKVFSHQRFVSH